MKVGYFLAMVLVLPTLIGCRSLGGGGLGGGSLISTYPNACTSMPSLAPSCMYFADNEEGFSSRRSFNSCRQSLNNYVSALDTYFDCSKSTLKNIFDDMLRRVPATYNCYLDYFKVQQKGDPSVKCPPVKVPTFYPYLDASGTKPELGVPRCIRDNAPHKFFPKRKYSLPACKAQVDVFTGKRRVGMSVSDFDAAPAQKQFDTFTNNLRRALNRQADEVVQKFNCLADGRKYCM